MSGYLSLANGTRLPIHDGFVLGRVAGCDLVLEDSKASRRHAKVHVENGVVEIEDLQSSNGTLLNDKPVTRRLLRDGDRVQIGKTVIVYHEGELPGAHAQGKPAAAALADNDLFGDAPATSVAPPPPPPPARALPVSSPAPQVQPARQPSAAPAPPVPPPAPTPPAPSPAPKVPAPAVVEFADEVVELRKPAPAAPAAGKPAAGGGPVVSAASSRVLQFHKQAAGGGGLLGDDLSQLGSGMRALLVCGVIALGAGIVWLVMRLVG